MKITAANIVMLEAACQKNGICFKNFAVMSAILIICGDQGYDGTKENFGPTEREIAAMMHLDRGIVRARMYNYMGNLFSRRAPKNKNLGMRFNLTTRGVELYSKIMQEANQSHALT